MDLSIRAGGRIRAQRPGPVTLAAGLVPQVRAGGNRRGGGSGLRGRLRARVSSAYRSQPAACLRRFDPAHLRSRAGRLQRGRRAGAGAGRKRVRDSFLGLCAGAHGPGAGCGVRPGRHAGHIGRHRPHRGGSRAAQRHRGTQRGRRDRGRHRGHARRRERAGSDRARQGKAQASCSAACPRACASLPPTTARR